MQGLNAGDRRLREMPRPQQVGVGVEGVDVQLADAVAPLPVVQQQVEMPLRLLWPLAGAVAAALIRNLALRHRSGDRLALFSMLNSMEQLDPLGCR